MAERSGVFWPALTLVLVSAASMALEIVAGRALAPYVGMSLYSWTMIIAVVLAGLSLGHWIGGVMSDRSSRASLMVAVVLIAAGLTAGVSLAVLRLIEPELQGFDPISHVGLLAMAAFFLPSVFAGVLSPLLTRMALEASPPDRQGRVLGLMFALGAFGAIVGTLIAGLALISWIGTTGSVLLIAGLYVVLGLRFFSRRGRIGGTLVILPAVTLGMSAPEAMGLRSACMVESAYFCIRVDDAPLFGRNARVMALDHLAHGVNDADDPRLLLSPYVQGVDELVTMRHTGSSVSAFFIGGGAYTLPRAWQSRLPQGSLTVAEVDPEVTRIAQEELWLTLGRNLRVLHGDARQVLRSLPGDEQFDIIFGDAFHDISVPAHLVTDEFHAEVAKRLAPGGTYVMNVVDALREPRFMLSLAQTLENRFAEVELWLDLEAVQPFESRTTWIVLASDRPTGAERLLASYGFGREWVQVPLRSMIDVVGREKLVFMTDDFAPVDRLLAPVLLNPEMIEASR